FARGRDPSHEQTRSQLVGTKRILRVARLRSINRPSGSPKLPFRSPENINGSVRPFSVHSRHAGDIVEHMFSLSVVDFRLVREARTRRGVIRGFGHALGELGINV